MRQARRYSEPVLFGNVASRAANRPPPLKSVIRLQNENATDRGARALSLFIISICAFYLKYTVLYTVATLVFGRTCKADQYQMLKRIRPSHSSSDSVGSQTSIFN